ncbi:MAG: glycosyltransferase family 1 protein [Lachnospiraceae bacterium]|nr:glycosyltransferase family 1 protein [Lachnospiraceae bacterium]
MDGEDLVIYYDLNDLKEKIAFYLANDDIRTKIAENGHKKAIAVFNIDDRLKKMFSL